MSLVSYISCITKDDRLARHRLHLVKTIFNQVRIEITPVNIMTNLSDDRVQYSLFVTDATGVNMMQGVRLTILTDIRYCKN